MTTFLLTTGDDTIDGTSGDDVFSGPSGGTDTLRGQGGDDLFRIKTAAAGSINGGNGVDTLRAVGFNLGTLSFSNMEKLIVARGSISASAAQLNAFTTISSTFFSGINIDLTGAGGALDFGALWKGNQALHIDASHGGRGTGYTLTGTHNQDFITGSRFTDTIVGGHGQDILDTGDGVGDVLKGGIGGDRLTSHASGASLKGGDGEDALFSYSDGTLLGGNGDDLLTSYAGTGNLNGGKGQDTLLSHSDGTLLGGADRDVLKAWPGASTVVVGGHGPDQIRASTGNDTFIYNSVADSNGQHHDKIHLADFANDVWDVPGTVTGIDAAITQGVLDGGAAFDTTLTVAVNAANLAANHAVLFTPDQGALAGHIFLIVDVNGVAGYQADQDLVIHLIDPQNPASLNTADFI